MELDSISKTKIFRSLIHIHYILNLQPYKYKSITIIEKMKYKNRFMLFFNVYIVTTILRKLIEVS